MPAASEQKVALVTGASLGIGFALSRELKSRGYKVYAAARRLGPMEALKADGIHTIQLDVADTESVIAAKKLIAAENNNSLHLLVNNAGSSCLFPCTDLKDEDSLQVYQANVFGPMRMVREFAPLIINTQGTITFTGSITGVVPFPFSAAYNSSKAAINQYAATLRLEMKPFNVKVLNIVTGGVDTNIADTRPLPKDSLYNTPTLLLLFETRKVMAKENSPMKPEVYARQVANDISRATLVNGSFIRLRGTMATLMGTILWWCPRFVLEKILITKFKLTKGFEELRQKYVVKGTKLE